MNHPHYLDKHDLLAGGSPDSKLKLLSTGDETLNSIIKTLAQEVSHHHDPRYLEALIMMGVDMANSDTPSHDFDVIDQCVYEMVQANKLFAPFRHIRKIAIFGSARIKLGEPAYQTALDFSQEAAEHGYMVITGGGPGIMQACNEGAGAERSFGLNIKLPYEQHSNHVIKDSPNLINFHYFFVRKLNFLARSDAMVAFPGGFGTMDEIFETMTLIQTGKATVYPIVLIDSPGKTFWLHWEHFVRTELIDSGLISEEDMNFIYITKSPSDAIEHIDAFYKIFHSYTFVDDLISIRLNQPISDQWIHQLELEFADLIKSEGMSLQKALPQESDEPLLKDLPRLIFKFNRSSYGRLRLLIDRINMYPEVETDETNA
ncbi:MAG: TIGR00730 family Rossman fold protein [Akkermansia sp.]